jgi:TonB family protein
MISHDSLAGFSALLWPALANHLWQASIAAAFCLIASPAFRSAGGKARHLLWALAFVRFAIPQALVFFAADHLGLRLGLNSSLGMRLQQVSGTVVQVARPSILGNQQPVPINSAPESHPDVYCILTVIWAAGCLFFLSRWWFRQYRFAKSLRAAEHGAGNEFTHLLESVKRRLGIRRNRKLRVVWQGSEPGVFGVWNPILVLPEEMPRQLSAAELEAVLAHELVHVARWDNLWSNLQMLVCCVFWFHPVVWLLDRCLIAERERSCDERVIEKLRNSQAYASGLIKVASIGLGLRIAGVSPMAGANLKRRIENMKKKNRTGLPARILLSAIASLIVLFYLMAAPLQTSEALTSSSGLAIENSESCPLKLISAEVESVSIPANQTKDVTAQLIKPKIVLKNNSDTVVSVYVLEFRKPGSIPFYLARTGNEIAPKGTDSIQTNAALYSAAEPKVAGSGGIWTVRIDVVRFKDGSLLTVHSSPIPPPGKAGISGLTGIPGVVVPGKNQSKVEGVPGGIVAGKKQSNIIGGISGGYVGEGENQLKPVPPPPPPPEPPSPPPPPFSRPAITGSNMQQPKLIRRVEPVYPALAKRARVQGRVVMQITVDEEGNVTEAKPLSGHPLLNDAAVAAVKQWKYSPAIMNGVPVSLITTATLDFKIK